MNLKLAGNHEHGKDIALNCLLIKVLPSAANSTTITCEHICPTPAMHVQCAHITSQHGLMATQTCNDGNIYKEVKSIQTFSCSNVHLDVMIKYLHA